MTLESSLSFPHLVDHYVENADERGQNIMRKRTLPSLLVKNYEDNDQFCNYDFTFQKINLAHVITNKIPRIKF